MAKKEMAKKKRKYTKKTYSVPRFPNRLKYPGVCPDVMAVQLRYSRQGPFTGAAPRSNVFRGNSCFDPDFSGVGSQPMGFDQWSAFYRRYRVIGSRITVKGGTIAANNTTGLVIVGLNTNTVLTNPTVALEAHYAKSAESVVTSAGSSSISATNYLSTAKIRGGPYDLVQYERDLSAATGANPVQQWYWHVLFYNADGTTGSLDINANVEITYFVEFFDRETLSQS